MNYNPTGWWRLEGYEDGSTLYAHGSMTQVDAFCASENSRCASRNVTPNFVTNSEELAALSVGDVGFDLDEEAL